MSAYSRVCPSCGRHVPHTVTLCRCGLELPVEEIPADESVAPSSSSSWRWLVIAAVAAIAGAMAGAYLIQVRTPAPSVPAERSATTVSPPATASPVPEPAHLEVESAAIPSPAAAPSPVPDVQGRPATDTVGSPALEDVLARVMPAVVLIETPTARGSGFFVSADTLLTNVHVVGSNSTVTIRRMGGESSSARVAATAAQFDIAMLKLASPAADQPTLTLASVADARIGQEVVAIGSALGMLQNTVTRGIVSGVRQTGDAILVQTDAAVNPGNSGGPLLDRTGRVIGITTMGFRGSQGLNFAVAIDHARPLLDGRPASPPPVSSRPAASSMRTLSPAVPSETDQARTDGMKTYEQTLAQLARRADTLDSAFRNFRASCYEGRVNTNFDRQWFALFEDRALQGAVPPGCGGWFNDIRREANDIRSAVVAAEEDARRADVFPGFRRETRRKYRLDYPGWDR